MVEASHGAEESSSDVVPAESDSEFSSQTPSGAMEPTQSLDSLSNENSRVETLVLGIPLQPSERPGSFGRLGDYEVLNHVGRGGMGIVVRAFDEQLHRNVAIKVMSPDLMSSDSARERFFREARAAAGINHPNVVTIHAVSEASGSPFLVMEFVDGRTLYERIRDDAPLSTLDVLRISCQVASGLAAAHKHGVVHRDIKPANILLEDGIERVKISDFGLARLALDRSDLTSLGNVVGTPSFMSPEQVEGKVLDHRTDLFSLGCVMYAMIAGRSPFRANNPLATARLVATQPHIDLQEICPDVPGYLNDIVNRLLLKNPDERFRNAEELSALLGKHLADANRSPGPTVPLRRVSEEAASGEKHSGLGIAAAIIMVAAIMGFVLFSSDRNDSASGTSGAASPAVEARLDDERVRSILADRIIHVRADGTAECESVKEALEMAADDCHIVIGDDSVYAAALTVHDRRGLRLTSSTDAVLTSEGPGAVVSVRDSFGVQIDGLSIQTTGYQHAIELAGNCEGLRISDCRLEAADPLNMPLASIFIHDGAAGTAADPIVIAETEISSGGVGVVIGEPSEDSTVRHVQIESCRIDGPSAEYGVAVAVQGKINSVSMGGNLFTTGTIGVTLTSQNTDDFSTVRLMDNTFHAYPVPLTLNVSPETTGIEIRDNLFLDAVEIVTLSQNVADYSRSFSGNWWEPSLASDESLLLPYFEIRKDLEFETRDPQRDEFLRPATFGVDYPGHLKHERVSRGQKGDD